MKLTIDLPPGPALGLRRYSNESGMPLEFAAAQPLEDWLIGLGYQETLHDFDKDTETAGSA